MFDGCAAAKGSLQVGELGEAPESDVERAMAVLWGEVLGVPSIGRHDDFFELGGHSLTLMALTGLVRQRHGFELPLKAVFEHPTLARLCQAEPVKSRLTQGRREQLAAIESLLTELE